MSMLNAILSRAVALAPSAPIGFFTKDYVAGPALDDAVRTTKALNARGVMATIDLLGESAASPAEAARARDTYLEVLETLRARGLDANVSLKPTQMGLGIDRSAALDGIRAVVARASELGNFVRLDMESSAWTDGTLELARALAGEFPTNVGTVLQAALRRTPRDIERLVSAPPVNVRLCKGIYVEPETVAYRDRRQVNASFMDALDRLLRVKAYVAIATHDPELVHGALRLIDAYGLKRDAVEFQMLLGVDTPLREVILSRGHRLRIYVPFGREWLAYSKRRLMENPSLARHGLRQIVRKVRASRAG